MHHFTRLAAAVVLMTTCAISTAQNVVPWQEYSESVKGGRQVSVVGDDAFGQKIDLSTGSLQFASTDVSLPGNNGLPVEVARILTIEDKRGAQNLGGFGDWDIDVPHIEGTFASSVGWAVQPASSPTRFNRCSLQYQPLTGNANFQAEDIWHGYRVHLPGGQTEELMKAAAGLSPMPANGQTYPWLTKSFGRVRCLSTVQRGYPGEGFELLTADGTKYKFDWPVERTSSTVAMPQLGNGATVARKQIHLLATRVEDRFGNWVTYAYSGDKLTTINSSDNRIITLSYTGDKVTSVVSAAGTWRYTYTAAGKLFQVTLPDTSKWTYGSSGSLTPDYVPEILTAATNYAECTEPAFGQGSFQYMVTHPAGAQATFATSLQRHYRTGVNYLCTREIAPHTFVNFGVNEQMDGYERAIYNQLMTLGYSHRDALQISTGYRQDQDGLALVDIIEVPAYDRLRTPNYFDVYSVVSQSVTGPGQPAVSSYYSYENPSVLGFCYPETGCVIGSAENPLGRWVTVSKSDGDVSRFYFGTVYAVNEGELLQSTAGDASGTVLREDSYVYTTTADIGTAGFPFPGDAGVPFRDELGIARNRPRKSATAVQQGVSFNSTTTEFDTWARPLAVVDSSEIGYRTSNFKYHDNLAKWVLGQQSEVKIDGVVTSETEFNPNAQPTVSKSFGLVTQTLGYSAVGTVSTVKDGANKTTTLSNWYRGIPRSVLYADGTTQSAVVSASGLVTAITDQAGSKTCIAYDAMGRVARIDYPSETTPGVCDTSTWAATTQSFGPVSTLEYGLPAGHWKQTVQTGNAVKLTYFDGRWRPKLVREYDAANVAATDRYQTWDYDADGQVAFASYPSSTPTPTTGIWNEYDALGRKTSTTQDSEKGGLVTLVQYQDQFKTRVTNPRGFATTTSYLAYDQPDTSAPSRIVAPNGNVTLIQRNSFGQTTGITRYGKFGKTDTISAGRRFTYDQYGRLCTTYERESGTTVYAYDAAGNVAWTAAGMGSTGIADALCDSDRAAALASGRRVDRTYDLRNRLSTLTFPDARGNQTFAYTLTGLPSRVTTKNTVGGRDVVNEYTYNRRQLVKSETMAQTGWYTWQIGYGYDALGNLASHSYPTGLSVGYAPNALGQATQAGSYATGVQYFPNGAVKQFTYGNGLVHTMSQNLRQLPETSADSGGALSQTYNYDANGNVENVVDALDPSRSKSMGYNGNDQLTMASSASYGGDQFNYFTYDALDNLRSWKLAGVKDLASYDYDANNRLTSIRNTAGATVHAFSYDPQGNVTSRNSVPHDFDYGNRLRSIPGIEDYRYDGGGRRVQTTKASGGTTLWMYAQNGQQLFSSKLPAGGGQTTHENVYLAGSLVASIDHAWPSNTILATKYQHTDALGSPVAVTNESGAVIERTNYDPYGGAIGNAVDGIGYTGHVMDPATGLTYMQQRYYNSGVGRFLSVDPVTASSVNGSNFNRYWYGNNSPYNFKDPDGRLAGRLDGNMPVKGGQDCNSNPSCRYALDAGGSRDSSKKSDKKTNGKPLAGFKGIAQGIFTYGKGALWDLPKHALTRYGVFGAEKELHAVRGEFAVIDATRLLMDDPDKAMRLAYRGFDLLPPEQQANIQGRVFGRFASGTVVTAATLGAGIAINVGSSVGSVMSAGVDIDDQGAVIRTILQGTPE